MDISKYMHYGNKFATFRGEHDGTVLIVIHCDEENRDQIIFI